MAAQTTPAVTNYVGAALSPLKPHGVYYCNSTGAAQWVSEKVTPAALAASSGGGSQPANAFSLGLWVNDSLVTTQPVAYMAQGRGQQSNETFQLRRGAGNVLTFTTSHTGAVEVAYTSALVPGANKWVYIVVSFNPTGNVVIYMWDGTTLNTFTTAATDANIFTPTMPISIGTAVGAMTSGAPSTTASTGRCVRYADAFFVNGYAMTSTDVQNARDLGAFTALTNLGKMSTAACWLLDKQVGPLIGQFTPSAATAYDTFVDQGPLADSLICGNNNAVDYTLSTLPAMHAPGGFRGVAGKMPFGGRLQVGSNKADFAALVPSLIAADLMMYRETDTATNNPTNIGAPMNAGQQLLVYSNYSSAGKTQTPAAQDDFASYPGAGTLGTTGPYQWIGSDIETGSFSSPNDQASSGAAATHGIDRTDAANAVQVMATFAHNNGFKFVCVNMFTYFQSYAAIWAGFLDGSGKPSVDAFLIQVQNQIIDVNTFLSGTIPIIESIISINPNAQLWFQWSVVSVPAGDVVGIEQFVSMLVGYPQTSVFIINWNTANNWGTPQIYAALYNGVRP